MGFGFLNGLTSFATGAADGENQQFNRVYQEQRKQDDITQQLVSRAAADVQKRQDDTTKRLQFKRGVMQTYGIDDDQADALANLPEDLRKDPEKLQLQISQMKPIPGQTVPATQQTQQVIRAPQSIRTGLLTPNINLPGVSAPQGENQPERQAYSMAASPDLNFPKLPPALDAEQTDAQRQVYAAYQQGPKAIAALDPAILQKAHSQANIEHEGQAMSQIIGMKERGTTNPDGSPYDYNAHFKALTGHAPRMDLNAITIPTNESQKTNAQKIAELRKAHPEMTLEQATDIVLGVIRPVTEGGNVGTININTGAFTPATMSSKTIPLQTQIASTKQFADAGSASLALKNNMAVLAGNKNAAGIKGAVAAKYGAALQSAAETFAPEGTAEKIDDWLGTSGALTFRQNQNSLVAQLATPILNDPRISDKEREFVKDIAGGGLDWHHGFATTMKQLQNLHVLLVNSMERHLPNIPDLAPPPNLASLPKDQFNAYGKKLMVDGHISAEDAQLLIQRFIKQQNGTR